MEFDSKVVIVTGASSGIGAACAVTFARLSAKLVLVGRNLDNLTKIANQCQRLNGLTPVVVVADISVAEDVDRIVAETINNFGRIDVLVNNAGVCQMSNVHDGVEVYDRVMGTNVRGTFLLTDKSIPHLLKTKGNVVNMSSILSTKPLPAMTAYCMSKAAIDMFTKSAALELGPKGVRINSVNPGLVKTNLFTSAGLSEEENEIFYKFYENLVPLRKITQVEDVANLVVFLASDKAMSITGSSFVVDCGATISVDNSSH